MNSPTADDAGFDFVTENGEVDTFAADRVKAIEEEKEEDEVNGSEEAQTKSDELEQNAATLQAKLECPFDSHKAFEQTLLKLEEYQNEHRQNQKEICVQIGELKKLVGHGTGTYCLSTELITQAAPANVVASGEEHRKLLTELEALRAQIAEVKGLHKMQEQRETQMLLRMDKLREALSSMFLVLIPQNRWDVAACHKLFIPVEPERLVVTRRDDKYLYDEFHSAGGYSSVFAEMPIPKKDRGIFYFELKVGEKKRKGRVYIHFGLAPRQMQLDDYVGFYKGSYAYSSWGHFWGHAVAGCRQSSRATPFIIGKPTFGAGDVVGCGLNLATRQIIYTKNGKRLDTDNLFVDSAADLFPCVSFPLFGNKIEGNFGPNFKFDIADGI